MYTSGAKEGEAPLMVRISGKKQQIARKTSSDESTAVPPQTAAGDVRVNSLKNVKGGPMSPVKRDQRLKSKTSDLLKSELEGENTPSDKEKLRAYSASQYSFEPYDEDHQAFQYTHKNSNQKINQAAKRALSPHD